MNEYPIINGITPFEASPLIEQLKELSILTEEIKTSQGEVYLRRYTVWQNSYGSCRLHEILLPDEERHLHDHPWLWATSQILHGGYEEDRRIGYEFQNQWANKVTRMSYRQGALNVIRPGDYHRISHVLPDTWTLFCTGPKVGSWGFLVDGKHVDEKDYPGVSGQRIKEDV